MNSTREERVIIAGSRSLAMADRTVLKELRGPLWGQMDSRLLLVMVVSMTLHILVMIILNKTKLAPAPVKQIHQIPERFAKLIIDKPLIKEAPKVIEKPSVTTSEAAKQSTAEKSEQGSKKVDAVKQEAARRSVAIRARQVEQKVRNVGVLGILSGTGGTAKGSAVVDVLGKIGDRKDDFTNLDKMLDKVAGLQKAPDVDVLNKTLVKSKEVQLNYRESIDDLLTDMREARTVAIEKKGNVIIQRPESIEGAASSDVLRDNEAINKVVSSKKISIAMSYQKFLKRDPTLEGKITIRFTIAASGIVTSVIVVENTTNNTELEQEIVQKVKMWRFTPISEGDVTVTYPFVFKPS